jgi:hypothetical protein
MVLAGQLHAGPGGTARPFKGSAEGVVTGVSHTGALIVESIGTATHLGKFARRECVSIDGADLSGALVFKAANGDELWAHFTGELTSMVTAEGTYTFCGGTGRFTDAAGTAGFNATLAVVGNVTHVTITFDGTIDY